MGNNKIISNLIWRLLERVGAQAVSLVVSIILARMLEPSVYGTIAIINVLIVVFQVFVDSGLGNALIQKKNADDVDFSSVFFANIAFCVVLYVILWCLSPWIASFFTEPGMISMVRVLGITILISGVKNVQQAYVAKNMQFKKFFFSTLGGTVVAAIAGIIMAFLGYGVWALIFQQVINSFVDAIILWLTVEWRPKLLFSKTKFQNLFSYGWKLLVSSLIDVGYNNLRSLIIGKMYTKVDLAFYDRAQQIPNIIVSNINASIDSVLLPAMSEKQDNIAVIRDMTRKAMKTSFYLIAPMMIGIFVVAEPLIRFFLTDKWLGSFFFLRIFCVTYMFYPVHTANLNAIKALGRSDIFLKLEIIKKVIGLIILASTMWFGVKIMAYGLLLTCISGQIINSYPNKKLLGYGYWSQIKDLLPAIIMSVIMGIGVHLVSFIEVPLALSLIIQIIVGIIIYVLESRLTNNDVYWYLYEKAIHRKK